MGTETRSGLFAAAAMMLLMGGSEQSVPPYARDRLRNKSRKQLLDEFRVVSAHTPTPEKMYETLIRAGIIRIERRRFKPPLIVWVKKKRKASLT